MITGRPKFSLSPRKTDVTYSHPSILGNLGGGVESASNFYGCVEYRHPSDHHIFREKGTRI